VVVKRLQQWFGSAALAVSLVALLAAVSGSAIALGGGGSGKASADPLWASVEVDGTITKQTGGITVSGGGDNDGAYLVNFHQGVNGRAILVTPHSTKGNGLLSSASGAFGHGKSKVVVSEGTSISAGVDTGFDIAAIK